MEASGSLPLPEDPALAAMAVALRDAGHWADVTPIVWLHYFALLLVVVAVSRQSLGVIWFVPLLMVVTPGSGHPTPFQTAWTLMIALVTVLLAVRESRGGPEIVLVPAAVRA